ncbi:hypothetical protein [Haloactinospora alba]|uniref:hypothetical protein n=1 Tax=Haloactinospora alba TaxID=405555 RepID=UPI001B86ED6B|nr:hypothetical protein [Haloactinospora alba]
MRREEVAHHVARRKMALHHPVAGDPSLDWDALSRIAAPEQQLIARSAALGTPTHDAAG